jgi:hypothetical protein
MSDKCNKSADDVCLKVIENNMGICSNLDKKIVMMIYIPTEEEELMV